MSRIGSSAGDLPRQRSSGWGKESFVIQQRHDEVDDDTELLDVSEATERTADLKRPAESEQDGDV